MQNIELKIAELEKRIARLEAIRPQSMEEVVSFYISPAYESAMNFTSNESLFSYLSKEIGASSVQQMGKLLTNIGYKRGSRCIKGKRTRGFYVKIRINPSQIAR